MDRRKGKKKDHPLKPEITPFNAGDHAIEELLGVQLANVLTRVFTIQPSANDPRRGQAGPASGVVYGVRDRAGRTVLTVSPVDMPDDDDRAEYVVGLLRALFCTSCAATLLDGETGQCVSCESTSIMDLVRMRDELR